ncbi:MAG TPA: proton-conducting transporter membrane subunit, partial [Acidobacteriaceae bacterium]
MNASLHLWLIPLLPFLGFLVNGLLGRRFPKPVVSAVALLFPLASFGVVARAALLAWQGSLTFPYIREFLGNGENGSWIHAGPLRIDFTFALDQLSLTMLLIITGVGFLIHLYSVGYMGEEEGYWRYFSYLNLFLFFMTVLVLAENYLLMFVGWEGVGLASYLLIGFYYNRDSAARAGRKAFVVNRVGDFGFLIGMFLLIAHFGSLSVTHINAALALDPGTQGGIYTA